MSVFIGVIAGAIAGGLIEYLLGLLLPKKPKLKHLSAITTAIIIFVLITTWSSSNQQPVADSATDTNSSAEMDTSGSNNQIFQAGGDINVILPTNTPFPQPTSTSPLFDSEEVLSSEIFVEEVLFELLEAKRAEASVLRILSSQICSPHDGGAVVDCISKQPYGNLNTSVAANIWNTRYLINQNQERIGFINEAFVYDLTGIPTAIIGDWGRGPYTTDVNLSAYFSEDTLDSILQLPVTTLPLIERHGGAVDDFPIAVIFSDNVEFGLQIDFVIEGDFTWLEVPTLEP